MSTPLQQQDFLCVSAYIRALEARLLTEADLTRMVDAPDNMEAIRVLQEHGYEPMEANMASVTAALKAEQSHLFEDLNGFQMDSRVFDFFRVRQDYHNAKVLLKSAVTKQDAARLLMDGGRIEPEEITRIINEGDDFRLPEGMQSAVTEARQTLAATMDAQRSDFILDRAFYAEVLSIAVSTENPFLIGYVQLMIDSDNAKALLRALKMMKADAFSDAVVEGGSVDAATLVAAIENGAVTEPFQGTALAGAVETIAPNIYNGTLTAFERTCDDVMTEYLQKAALIPYGIEPVVAYIAVKQREIQNVRIIMNGRLAGLSPKTMRERMRMSYV